MSALDLLGDPLPEPLPHNSRLTSEDELVGHEIRAVFLNTQGTYGFAGMVIVTATGCWIALDCEQDGDDAYLTVERPSLHGEPVALTGYVPANQLRATNCVSEAEFTRLSAIEAAAKEQEKARRVARLRAQLAAEETQP